MTSRRAFGEALRRERERRGITLESISDSTKISVALLASLERGDCSRWPAGIYSRAYVRDYAQAVGLDRDEIAAQFTACFSETAFPEGEPGSPSPDRRPREPAGDSSALRLTLEEAPRERPRVLVSRMASIAFDSILAIVLAALFSVVTGSGFWMCVAGSALCCHAGAVLGGDSSTAALLVRAAARRQRRLPQPGATDPALAEAA